METRAPFVVVGAFVLAAIAAVFGFVYWLHNTGGLGPRATYHVQFEGSVPGLLVGAAVLFNGIRVGEVTDLGLAPDNPRRVNATISVASTTPVRSDTKVGLEFQGLTGVPVVALEGGELLANSGAVPTLIAEPGAGQSMTQAARDALRRVDSVLAENAEPLKNTIANLQVFSEGLARNTGKLDGIVAGLERMTGGERAARRRSPTICARLQDPGPAGKTIKGQLAIPEPTAVAMLETQRILFSPAERSSGICRSAVGRSIPKLLQARLIESFENYDIAHAPLRSGGCRAGGLPASDRRQAFSGRDGSRAGRRNRIVGADRRQERQDRCVAPVRRDPEARQGRASRRPSRRSTLAFGRIAKEMIAWTVQALP